MAFVTGPIVSDVLAASLTLSTQHTGSYVRIHRQRAGRLSS